MRRYSNIARLARRCLALAVSATLVVGFPVYASPSTESSATTAVTSPTTAQPAAGTNTAHATSSWSTAPARTATGTIAPSRPDPEASVIGDVGVDKETEAFRKKLAERQAQLDAFEAQLSELDSELAIAAEAYNAATDRLNSMKRQVLAAQLDLKDANAAYEQIDTILSDQMGTIYRTGTYSPFEMLLDSKSLRDFLSRLKFLNKVGTDSAQIIEEYAARQSDLERQVFKLENAEKLAQSLEFELKARKIEVELRITERQELLASAQSDLLELLSAEATRRQKAEAELLKQILAGAAKVGISIEPSSPVETVLSYHGVPYLWGGESPSGFDCSGLILYVMRQHGVELPHYSGSQFLLGEKIAPADLQPGDVVFFGSPIHHVGMYIGGGYYVHAPRTGDFVKISRLADRFDYAGARRYAWQPRTTPVIAPQATAATVISTAR